ncbi:MAG TPA: hypothetical protein VMS04_11055 [Vicinamibacterales bacterium]|jgi:hypothetical protein|nr:hypothetical protein [Vicinamibacterales bacterium]
MTEVTLHEFIVGCAAAARIVADREHLAQPVIVVSVKLVDEATGRELGATEGTFTLHTNH